MTDALLIGLGVLCAAFGGAAVWMALAKGKASADAAAARAERDAAIGEAARLESKLDKAGERARELELESARLAERVQKEAELSAEREAAAVRRERDLKQTVMELTERFKTTFAALSGSALKEASAQFLQLAESRLREQQQHGAAAIEERRKAVESLVQPIAETLRKTEAKLGDLDRSRVATEAGLSEQLRAASDASRLLRDETSKLVRALREPHVRGRYGEMQLKRVAELAGMSAYCDFAEQASTVDADGNALRPDMIVKLPSERVVVVDAKTSIQAYLDAFQAETPAAAEECLDRFAQHVAAQAAGLAKKKYWAQYDGSPEFVVMFMPGDQFIDAALSRQPELLEQAARQNVLLAGPATLIGLLRAVHIGYKEQKLAKAAEELRELGKELHERAAKAFGDMNDLGGLLEKTVKKYNECVGSYQWRLEPTLRKFEEAGARGPKELPVITVVEPKVKWFQGEGEEVISNQ